jgi:hypothetical protein
MVHITLNEKLRFLEPPVDLVILEGVVPDKDGKFKINPKLEAIG